MMMIRLVPVEDNPGELAMIEEMDLNGTSRTLPTTPVHLEPLPRRKLVPNLPSTILKIPYPLLCL
jgi:hypothetical protein